MDTKKLLIFGAGAVAGYLLYKQFSKKQEATETTTTTGQPSAQTDAIATECQAMLDERLKVVRMSADAIDTFKKQFLLDCTTKTGEFAPMNENTDTTE